MEERHTYIGNHGVLNHDWEAEGVTQESVDRTVKQRRKQRSVFYRWWLQRQIKKCQKHLENAIKDPVQATKILLQQKKYVDELAYIDAMRFNKRTGRV